MTVGVVQWCGVREGGRCDMPHMGTMAFVRMPATKKTLPKMVCSGGGLNCWEQTCFTAPVKTPTKKKSDDSPEALLEKPMGIFVRPVFSAGSGSSPTTSCKVFALMNSGSSNSSSENLKSSSNTKKSVSFSQRGSHINGRATSLDIQQPCSHVMHTWGGGRLNPITDKTLQHLHGAFEMPLQCCGGSRHQQKTATCASHSGHAFADLPNEINGRTGAKRRAKYVSKSLSFVSSCVSTSACITDSNLKGKRKTLWREAQQCKS